MSQRCYTCCALAASPRHFVSFILYYTFFFRELSVLACMVQCSIFFSVFIVLLCTSFFSSVLYLVNVRVLLPLNSLASFFPLFFTHILHSFIVLHFYSCSFSSSVCCYFISFSFLLCLLIVLDCHDSVLWVCFLYFSAHYPLFLHPCFASSSPSAAVHISAHQRVRYRPLPFARPLFFAPRQPPPF